VTTPAASETRSVSAPIIEGDAVKDGDAKSIGND
jgi:hypothetical protein